MTNSPPPDPQSSQNNPLGFDEFIGIFVALTTIGAILFWSLSRGNQGFNLTSLLSPSPSPSAQPTFTPVPEATTGEEAPVLPPATVTPTESPQVLAPVPDRRTGQQIPIVVPFRTTTPQRVQQTPAPTQPINFVDVPQDYWARSFIDDLSARGIVTGFAGDYFRPDRPVTRAEFAAILQDAFDQKPGQGTANFRDVQPNFWAVPAITRTNQTGFLKGYPGNVFRPQQEIPRVQVLVALANGLNLPTASSSEQVLGIYNDANKIPNYATERVAAATANGLVVNYPNAKLLNPNRNATRAEVAAIVHQALVRAGKAEPIQSQYAVPARP